MIQRMIAVSLPESVWDEVSALIQDSLPPFDCEGCEGQGCDMCHGAGQASSVWHPSQDSNPLAQAEREIDRVVHDSFHANKVGLKRLSDMERGR